MVNTLNNFEKTKKRLKSLRILGSIWKSWPLGPEQQMNTWTHAPVPQYSTPTGNVTVNSKGDNSVVYSGVTAAV